MKAFPKDIEIQTLKERHVGIESELSVTDIDGYKIPPDVEGALHKTGLLQSVGYDGGGREFRTHPISLKSIFKQKQGRERLEGYYLELSHHTEVLTSGGTHIHISILDSDNENMEANAITLATAFYSQFQKIAGRNTHWAYNLKDYDITSFKRVKEYLAEHRGPGERVYYTKGSMLAPTGHKTLEFRGPKGSNSPDEVLAWVDFLRRVVEVANQASIKGVKFSDLLTGSYISKYAETLSGNRKLSRLDLNKTVNLGRF